MDDNGLDWEWTRTEFRKALLACTHAATDGDLSEAVELLYELRTCSLLILNFRQRLSSKQHKGLSDLAAVTDLEDINLDDEWDVPEGEDRFARLRFWLEKAIKQARESSSLFEGI